MNEELKDSSTSEDDDFEEDKIDIREEDIEFRDGNYHLFYYQNRQFLS